MRRLKKTIFQLLICFALCIVATLSFAGSKDVIVANPDSQPVPVTNVENPDKLPRLLPLPLRIDFLDGMNEVTGYMGSVPAGKRWVIEHVSAVATMPLEQRPLLGVMISGAIVHWVLFSSQGDQYHYIASQPLKLRLSAGETLAFSFWRQLLTGTANVYVYVSGYEIDYP